MHLIPGLATLLSLVCFAPAASAHAALVSAEPGDGSVLVQAPQTVRLRFNEPVTPSVIGLIDAAGRARDDVTVRAVDATIVLTLPDNLPRGSQIVSYRVISQDGHPVGGSMVFSIGHVSGAAAVKTSADAVAGLIWLARIGVYLGLFAGVGGAFFITWIAGRRIASRPIEAAFGVGVTAAVASLGLGGLDALALPVGALATAAPWKAAAATSLGPSLLTAVVAMAIGLAALRDPSQRLARALSALAMAGVGLSLALSGHAATAPPQWLTRPALFLHGIGVAFWAGALVPLAAVAWGPTEGWLAVVNRFSRAAVPLVGMLVLTGLAIAVIQLGSLAALVGTRYGIILSVKLTLVAVLLGLAAFNRFRLTPAIARGRFDGRPLARSIVAECAVMLAILAVVAGWRFTPPPRALAAAVVTPLAIHIHTDQAMFQVLISPATVGRNSFVLQLMNGDASPLAASEAVLILSLPERGIEPLERKAALGSDGYWHVADVPLPYPGRWHLRIEALVTDFQKIALEDEFELPPR